MLFNSSHEIGVPNDLIKMSDKRPQKLPNMSDKTIGQRIRYARKLRGLTQPELADRVGLKQQTIGKYETGITKRPEHIEELAVELGVSPAWLYFGDEDIDSLDKDSIELALAWQSLPEPYKTTMKNAIFGMNPPDDQSES